MKKLFALFTLTALAACSSNSNPLTSATDEEELSSSSFTEVREISSSSIKEDISSSSATDEIQSSSSNASAVCIVDKFTYDVVNTIDHSNPYISLSRHRESTDFDKADCDVTTTFVTPQNDTLTYNSLIDVGAPVYINVPINLQQSTLDLVHIVRTCVLNSETTVEEFDSDCVLVAVF